MTQRIQWNHVQASCRKIFQAPRAYKTRLLITQWMPEELNKWNWPKMIHTCVCTSLDYILRSLLGNKNSRNWQIYNSTFIYDFSVLVVVYYCLTHPIFRLCCIFAAILYATLRQCNDHIHLVASHTSISTVEVKVYNFIWYTILNCLLSFYHPTHCEVLYCIHFSIIIITIIYFTSCAWF